MRFKSKLRAFGRDRNGAQAVEFAIIAPVLFAFMFGVFEIGRVMYEESRVAAAAAVGVRAVTLYGDDEDAITDAINAKLPYTAVVGFEDVTFGGQDFKKIDVTYDFDFLIKFTDAWSGVTISATRYAPVMS